MDASLLEVYIMPQWITYKIRNGVAHFRLKDHLITQNKSQIIRLSEDIKKKECLGEEGKEIIKIIQIYLSSLSNLNGDEKNAPSKKQDDKDNDGEKMKDPKKKGEKNDDDDKKDEN